MCIHDINNFILQFIIKQISNNKSNYLYNLTPVIMYFTYNIFIHLQIL